MVVTKKEKNYKFEMFIHIPIFGSQSFNRCSFVRYSFVGRGTTFDDVIAATIWSISNSILTSVKKRKREKKEKKKRKKSKSNHGRGSDQKKKIKENSFTVEQSSDVDKLWRERTNRLVAVDILFLFMACSAAASAACVLTIIFKWTGS